MQVRIVASPSGAGASAPAGEGRRERRLRRGGEGGEGRSGSRSHTRAGGGRGGAARAAAHSSHAWHDKRYRAVAKTVINHREPQHNLYRRPHHSQRESPTKAYRGTMDGDQEMNEFDDFNESTTSLTVSELGKVQRLEEFMRSQMSIVSSTLAISNFPVEIQGEFDA